MFKFKAQLLQGAKQGATRLPSAVVQFSNALGDWRDFWATVFIPRYLHEVQQNFETEGELSGLRAGWPDLEPRYATWKARHFPSAKILERSRRLRNSLSPSALGSRDMVLEAGPRFLRLGTRVSYARFHGFTRPFLVPVRQAEWRPIIAQWIQAHGVRAGLMKRSSGGGGGTGGGGMTHTSFMDLASRTQAMLDELKRGL